MKAIKAQIDVYCLGRFSLVKYKSNLHKFCSEFNFFLIFQDIILLIGFCPFFALLKEGIKLIN